MRVILRVIGAQNQKQGTIINQYFHSASAHVCQRISPISPQKPHKKVRNRLFSSRFRTFGGEGEI
nr:MAG TPA: hypothetical protein [Bacteriophage sp.]